MQTVQDLVKKFGTMSSLAKMLDVNPSLIAYWIKAETIPAKWHGLILDGAAKRGIDIKPDDILLIGNKSQAECSGIKKDAIDSNAKRIPLAKWSGSLQIGEAEIPCYVLDNGERVISRGGATAVLTSKEGGVFERYIGVSELAPYLPPTLDDLLIEFNIENVVNRTVKGMLAETFLEICNAYLQAFKEGALTSNVQREIAIQSMMFLSSCAKVGFIALIDEATGYQYARAEDALEVKLKAFLSDEMRKWEKTFPDELWKEFGRLTNWKGVLSQRPKYWGKLVMELVYDYLDKEVADWLKQNVPKPRYGRNYHQWLSDQYGLQKLMQHIWMIIGMARTCNTMTELKEKMAVSFGRKPVQFTLYLPSPGLQEKTN